MNEPVVAVEIDARQPDAQVAGGVGNSAPAGAAGPRFVYPGGSRPLEGFTIKRGIGHGGFGEVYYALSDGGKEVALKLIRRNLDVELRGIRQCLNLKHPNLLSIYDIREDGQGDKWVVMEYITGDCLADVVAAHPHGMPLEQALAWIHGIGAGVAYLHDHGIVHRDLKPGNIFSDQGLVKIGDYGLSKFMSCSRRSGQTESIGTVHYMAPEVANGRYGKEIDVYALGVILYEMLTGRVPFDGESVGEVLMKHLTATPDVSMLAEPFRRVVARALEKDPSNRYRSAAEMLAALPLPLGAKIESGTPDRMAGTARASGGSHPYATTLPAKDPLADEPILRAVRRAIQNARASWRSNLNGPTRAIILVMILFVIIASHGVVIPLAISLFFLSLFLYCAYWLVRAIVLMAADPRPRSYAGLPPLPGQRPAGGPREPPRAPPAEQPPLGQPAPDIRPQAAAPSRRELRRFRRARSRVPRWAREEPADALVLKPFRERMAELLGSLLGGAAVSIIVCLMLAIIKTFGATTALTVQDYARYAWLALSSIAITWTVLVVSKVWEGSRGDTWHRRFVLMVFGLGLGLAAASAAGMLMVDLPHRDLADLPVSQLTGMKPVNLFGDAFPDNTKYFLIAFAVLMALVRWWRQADPLRSARLSLGSVFLTGLMAALVADGVGFPQPWLVMVASAASIAVQLASPWVDPSRRAAESRGE